jgi:DNA-binding IclR family transcriptional regulator
MQRHAILRNMTAQPSNGRPRATDRGLALLRVVADHPDGIALADAARAVELTPSTALRQLRSLESAGFASRDGDGRFAPGPELLRIARSLSANVALPRLAEPVLAELAEATGESAYLAEPVDGRRAVYVAMAPGTHAIRHVSWLGQHLPRRGTAVGAALVGAVDADGAVVRTDAVEPGVTAVSAPVRGSDGSTLAALSLVGPSFRLTGHVLADARAEVARQAAALSAAAGAPVRAGAGSRSGRTARTP